METRALTPAETNTLIASIACRKGTIHESISSAADDMDIPRLKALLADYDTLEELLRRLRAGHLRLTGQAQ